MSVKNLNVVGVPISTLSHSCFSVMSTNGALVSGFPNCKLALSGSSWVLRAHGISTLSHSCFPVVFTNGALVSGFSNCKLALCGSSWVLRAYGISTLSHSCFTVVSTNGALVSGFPNYKLASTTSYLLVALGCSWMVNWKGSYWKFTLYWVNWDLCISILQSINAISLPLWTIFMQLFSV